MCIPVEYGMRNEALHFFTPIRILTVDLRNNKAQNASSRESLS
jgi:hypothetical protein